MEYEIEIKEVWEASVDCNVWFVSGTPAVVAGGEERISKDTPTFVKKGDRVKTGICTIKYVEVKRS
jgi:hypothetical protein